MNAARGAISGLVGLACITGSGCSSDGYVVVVRFETPALAASVEHLEVSLVAACAMQGRSGEPAVGARQSIDFARGTSAAVLGDAPPGTYGLYARGSASACSVVAAGCTDVTLAAGGEGELVVTLAPVAGPGCPAGTTCTAGACRGPDAGIDASVGSDAQAPPPDAAGFDADLPDAAGFDADLPDTGGGGCVPGPDSCRGGVVSHCATGGLITMTPCALGCSPTDLTRCARVVPSNVASRLLTSGTMDFGGGALPTLDTSSCGLLGIGGVEMLADGSEVCVVAFRNVTIPAGMTFRATGSRPVVLLASGDIDIAGTLDVSAYGQTPGPGGGHGGDSTRADGTGDAAGHGGAHVGTYADGGGGGGGMCGAGAAGGMGGAAAGGSGGVAAAAATELSPLSGGSGGGRGGNSPTWGFGGAGGGALQLTAAGSITITGTILAGGGGGMGGPTGPMCTTNAASGGGGGSGGAILIEATTISVAGASFVAAGGGGGGGASACLVGESAGGDGQDGADAVSTAIGGVSGGPTFGAAGGDGGGFMMLDGLPGGANANSNSNGGGGGGGAGCILFRDATGSVPAGAGVMTPAVEPGLRGLPVRVE